MFSFYALCSCGGKHTGSQVTPIEKEQVYMFSYFKGNKGDGLHLAYSYDGLKWLSFNNDSAYVVPVIGKDKLMRAPSIVLDEDGTFHMVWTTWWNQGIGYASSKDLKNWSEQVNISVMEKFEGTKNTWASELFYDKKDTRYFSCHSTNILCGLTNVYRT